MAGLWTEIKKIGLACPKWGVGSGGGGWGGDLEISATKF